MLELILAALLAFPAYHGDHETGEAREARLAPYAAGIARHARTADEAAAMVAIGQHESRWAAYVTDGRCHEGPAGQRCDNGRARGPWQLHGWCKAKTPDGEAECAARLLRYARGHEHSGPMPAVVAATTCRSGRLRGGLSLLGCR
jgi:hypothetical protein